MAKPKTGVSSRKHGDVAERNGKKAKSKGVSTKSKKPFKRSFKKSTVKPVALTSNDKEVKVGGVKRSRPQDNDKTLKKQKLSAPPPSRKERRVFRKSQRPHSELSNDSKSLWEKLRRHDLSKDVRLEVMDKLMTLLTGHFHELSVKHDTTRVVQSCLKNGTTSQRSIVFNELKDHIVELSKLKYAKFTVKAMFKYCTQVERGHVITGLYGNVRKLIRHTEAAEIVEIAYNDYANASQRAALIQEFYGPTFTLFKTESPRPLTLILADNSEHKVSILNHLKESLTPLLEKSAIKHSLVHRALLDYFTCCEDKDRADMIELLREVVVNILHTKEGSKVTLNCLWHGTAKDRKLIVKSFKSFVRKICLEENGHVVLLGLLDCVDDTVLVRKALLSEVVSNLEDICNDTFGRHVILYLLAPRCNRHFSPQFVDLLTPGDGNQYSKKSSAVRSKELLLGVAEPLVSLATKQAGEWARSKPHAPLLLQIAESLERQVDLCPLYESLMCDLTSEFNPEDENHLAVHPCGHWVVRRLLAGEAGKVEKKKDSRFAEMLMDRLTNEQVKSWVGTNRGAFVVCSLLMSGVTGVKGRLSSMLEPVISMLKEGKFKGQEALFNELNKDPQS